MKEMTEKIDKKVKCFVQFDAGSIDVNGMQLISAGSIKGFWASEQTITTRYERSWNFLYVSNDDPEIKILTLRRIYLFPNPLKEEGGFYDKYFRAWLALYSRQSIGF